MRGQAVDDPQIPLHDALSFVSEMVCGTGRGGRSSSSRSSRSSASGGSGGHCRECGIRR
jgi:hypothetical protein